MSPKKDLENVKKIGKNWKIQNTSMRIAKLCGVMGVTVRGVIRKKWIE